MRAERNGSGLRKQTASLVSKVTFAIHFGELTFALLRHRAFVHINHAVIHSCHSLLVRSTGMDFDRVRHPSLCVACDRDRTARDASCTAARRHRPNLLLAFMVGVRLSLPDGGRRRSIRRSRRLRLVSLCPLLVHHNPTILMASLLRHHHDHHRYAQRNYGVTTTLWDRVFGTTLERRKVLAGDGCRRYPARFPEDNGPSCPNELFC